MEHRASALLSLWWPGDLVPLDWSSFCKSLSPRPLPSCAGGLVAAKKVFSSSPTSPGTDKSERGKKKITTSKFNFCLV